MTIVFGRGGVGCYQSKAVLFRKDNLLANHASALKRVKQSEKRRLRNKAVRTKIRNTLKSLRQVIAQGQAAEAEAALKGAMSVLDKAAGRGVLHANKASRHISRLSHQVQALKA